MVIAEANYTQVRVSERAQRDQITKLKADCEFAESQRAMYEAQLLEKEQAVQAANIRIDELMKQAHTMPVCNISHTSFPPPSDPFSLHGTHLVVQCALPTTSYDGPICSSNNNSQRGIRLEWKLNIGRDSPVL